MLFMGIIGYEKNKNLLVRLGLWIGFVTLLQVLFLAGPQTVWSTPFKKLDLMYQTSETIEALLDLELLVNEAMIESPSNDELAWRQTRIYFALGKLIEDDPGKEKYFSQCIDQAEKTIRLNKQSALGYFFRGLCRGKLGQIKGIWKSLGAITPLKNDMETAVKLDPSIDQGGPHRALGKLYYSLPFLLGGSLDKSIGHLEKAVQHGPRYGENYFFLAQALYAKNEFLPAKNALQTLMKVTRDSLKSKGIQSLRQEAQMLLNKIDARIDSQESHAQRTEDQ